MDYHSDRFIDNSLMFYDDSELVAVLPASRHDHELRSHGGLTYGGIISNRKMTVQKMLDVFISLKEYMKENEISKLLYKRVPSIYYTYPSDEDLYALFVNNAKLIRRDVSTTIDLTNRIYFNERRKRNIKKAQKANLEVRLSLDFDEYISLLSEILQTQHNTKPVHSGKELQKLNECFPENIKLYGSFLGNRMVAGTVVFETPTVIHTQYLANSTAGREIGALDFAIEHLILLYSSTKRYLDFGISTENDGLYLNDGLISQKQEFGGRAVVYDFYELKV
jgi:hypothetical protein